MSEAERLLERLRPYVQARVIVHPMIRGGYLGVPVNRDPEVPEGEPWCNPDRPEVRIHPADYDRVKRLTENPDDGPLLAVTP